MRDIERTKLVAIALALLAVGVLAGCSQHKEMGFTPKATPLYITPPSHSSGSAQTTDGSLWVDGSSIGQVNDFRARQVNDLVTIKVVESTTATNSAEVNTERDDTSKRGLTSLLGLQNRLLPASVDDATAVSADTDEQFESTGSNTRSETISTTLTARVIDRLPNGNLIIQAQRELIVNQERQTMIIMGIIRPVDIDDTNSVLSTNIADLQIGYSGNGVLTENMRRGWFSRFINYVWPF